MDDWELRGRGGVVGWGVSQTNYMVFPAAEPVWCGATWISDYPPVM